MKTTFTKVFNALRGRRPPRYGWFGRFNSWSEATAGVEGYAATCILERVKEAALQVKNGSAACERDSVILPEIEYSWPLLANLMFAAAHHLGELNVLDFGGSLGTTLQQNRRYLQHIKTIRWNIIEQEHFVHCGKKHFEDNNLKFYHSIEACMAETRPNAVLISSSLQYLPEPFALLKQIRSTGIPFLILDRIPVFEQPIPHRITLHRIEPSIYPALIPTHIFSEAELAAHFGTHYETISNSSLRLGRTLDDDQVILSRGFLLVLKEHTQ